MPTFALSREGSCMTVFRQSFGLNG